MKLAYGDPPYLHQAKRHYSNDPSGILAEEVDHEELIERLLRDYDGWALSCSTPSLYYLESLIHGIDPNNDLHPEVRTAAWIKPFASWKCTHRVQYTWEPVIFLPVRPRGSRSVPSVRDFINNNPKDETVDYVSANITMRRGTHGAKPDAFNDWILNILGYQNGDTLDDLYPGSGSMAEAIKRFNNSVK
jgi:hypothetical protein